MKKIAMVFFAAAAMLFFAAEAGAAVVGGNCGDYGGDNAKWSLDTETGVLSITGSGVMGDYSYGLTPWYGYREQIRTIIVNEGITTVGTYVFANLSVENVSLPEGLTEIKRNGFYSCNKLAEIQIPSSVTSIGYEAFVLSGIRAVFIPAATEYIDSTAFQYCQNLEEIVVDENNPSYLSEDGVLFNKGSYTRTYLLTAALYSEISAPVIYCAEKSVLIQYPSASKKTSYAIPDTVQLVNRYAFYGSTSLTELTIPDSVAEIGKNAFEQNKNLAEFIVSEENTEFSSVDGVLFNKDRTELLQYPIGNERKDYHVPEGTVEITNNSFADCVNLYSVTIPASVTLITPDSFNGCDNLVRFEIESSGEDTLDLVDINAPFRGCKSLRSIVLPDNINAKYMYSYSPLVNIIYKPGTATGDILESSYGEYCLLGTIIDNGQPSSVVASAAANIALTLNGKQITGYTVNGVIYVSESDLSQCGFSLSWDGEARSTKITPPQDIQCAIDGTVEGEVKSVSVVSSDIVFKEDGYTIPSLNIGNGESILDLNAVLGFGVY